MQKKIDTLMMSISKYRLMFFGVIVICLATAAVFIFLGIKFHQRLLIIVGPLLSITPAVFVRLKINLIAKKATIAFNQDFIEITSSGILNEKLIYSDIKYFSASDISVDKASRIKFILKNGAKRHYIFFKQFGNDENILSHVLLYFSSYNSDKIQEGKIHMLPSFYVTKGGKLIVAVIGFLILAIIIMQIMYRPKTTTYSIIFVLAIYAQIRRIQMNDSKILKKFQGEN